MWHLFAKPSLMMQFGNRSDSLDWTGLPSEKSPIVNSANHRQVNAWLIGGEFLANFSTTTACLYGLTLHAINTMDALPAACSPNLCMDDPISLLPKHKSKHIHTKQVVVDVFVKWRKIYGSCQQTGTRYSLELPDLCATRCAQWANHKTRWECVCFKMAFTLWRIFKKMTA